MTKPRALPTERVHNKLANRTPIQCAVCDRFIGPFVGLPVILDAKDRVIEFVHLGCCVNAD